MANKKIKNKAFTVIELIAVIVVLAIILAITVPGITGIIRTSTMKAVESDAKLVLDSIRLKKIENDNFDPITLTKSNVSNLLGLSDENYSDLEVKINEGQTYIKITGQGKWSGFSVCGTYFNMQVNEGDCYLDFNDPVITLLGDSFVSINVGEAYNDAGATANDVEDGDITDRILKTGTVNPSVPGTYNITYNVSDTAGREALSVTRTVYVIDTEAPVITILGDNPVNMNIGDTYSDAGATALDDADGDVTSRTVTTGTVNPSIAGTYSITYTVSDNAGHESTAVRTVNVIDNVLPTVAFGTNGNVTWAKTRSTTVTVSDAHTGVNASSLKYQWTTSTTSPTEASFTTTFTNGGTVNTPAGVTGAYYLWILAKDNAGNTTIISTNVFNLDNTVPSVPSTNFNGYTLGTWTTGNINLNLSSADSNSGIQKYQWSLDQINWYDMVNPWLYDYDTNQTTSFRAVDNAGNASNPTSYCSIKRDTVAPSVPSTNFNGYTLGTWSRVNMTLNLSSTDATSGIMTYQWSSDGATWHDMPSTWLYNYDTNQLTRFRAVDNAGNAGSPTSACSIKRDTVAPVITMNGSNPVSIAQGSSYTDAGATANDALSGLSGSVVSTGTVNVNVAGTYYIYYNVSDNAGNVATQVVRTINVNALAVFATNGSSSAPLYQATYNGSSWGLSQVNSASWSNVSAANANTVFATNGSTYGPLYRSTYNGSSWDLSLVNSSTWSNVSAADANTVFATNGSSYGPLYRSTYNGSSWALSEVHSSAWSNVSAANANTVFATNGGSYGPLYRSTYNGSSWALSEIHSSAWSNVSAADANTVFATNGSSYGPLYRFTYNGSSWTLSEVHSSTWSNISAVDANTVFATNGSAYGALYRFTYNGSSWTLSEVHTSTWSNVSAANATTVFATNGSGYGPLYRSTYNGSSWSLSDVHTSTWSNVSAAR